MHNHKQEHDPSGGLSLERTDRDLGPYWRRAHRDWRFWVGVVFLTAAIAIYVGTIDLALVPHTQLVNRSVLRH